MRDRINSRGKRRKTDEPPHSRTPEPGVEKDGYICPICQRVFDSRDELLNHESTHEPQRVGAPGSGLVGMPKG